jgi:hypothetical protein
MDMTNISRRNLLTHGSTVVAGLALLYSARLAQALPMRLGEEVIPWLDQRPENPRCGARHETNNAWSPELKPSRGLSPQLERHNKTRPVD